MSVSAISLYALSGGIYANPRFVAKRTSCTNVKGIAKKKIFGSVVAASAFQFLTQTLLVVCRNHLCDVLDPLCLIIMPRLFRNYPLTSEHKIGLISSWSIVRCFFHSSCSELTYTNIVRRCTVGSQYELR